MRCSDKTRESVEVSNSYFADTGKMTIRQCLGKSRGQNFESGGQGFESLRARQHPSASTRLFASVRMSASRWLGRGSNLEAQAQSFQKILAPDYKAGARTGTSSGDFMGYADVRVEGRWYCRVGVTSRRFGCAGDSGSVVVSGGSSPDLLGLYFAGEAIPCSQGSGPTGFFIPLAPDTEILDALRDQVIHWSEDGKKLGGGSALEYYAGSSAVTAMIPYKNGVLTAFSN
jgi:hypothetical protein